MKVQQEVNNNIEYIGEIKENKVGIDRANVDFIATLLTSNLYSNPFESFLRETVSNAYDSHIEAKTDHPIILMIEGNEKNNNYTSFRGFNYIKESYNISVRDYGVGISPERFQKIYTNIGSSTKRDSNDYIGGWGIGRFSALSCSDNVQINSYYNGIKYSYIMYKNGTGINIDKISETKGDYKQGVEVCINNIMLEVDSIVSAIGKLVFFENLVVHANNISNDRLKLRISAFNDRKIDKFDNFSTCNFEYIDNGIYAKVGKVLYKTQDTGHSIFSGYNFIAVECPIGSINVTPNREQLQYTDKTNRKLKEVFDKSFEEMNQIAKDLASKNFDSIQSAWGFYAGMHHLKLAPRITFDAQQILQFDDLKIKEEKIPRQVWTIIQKMVYEDVPDTTISDIYNKKGRRTIKKYTTYRKLLENDTAIKCDDRLKNVTKSYYCDVISTNLTYVIKKTDIRNLLTHVVHKCCTNRGKNISKIEVLKALSFILKNYKYNKLENDKVPSYYIKEYKDKFKSKKERKTNETIEIRNYRGMSYNIMDFNVYINYYVYKDSSRKELKGTHMVVYSANVKDDTFIRHLEDAFRCQSIKFITLKKEHLPFVPKNKIFVPLENFLNLQQKIIAKAATADYLAKKYSVFYESMGKGKLKYCEHKRKFYQYINKYDIHANDADIKTLIQQYQDKKWLDWAAIIEFSLSDEDIKRITQRQVIDNLDNVVDSLLYVIKHKYVNDDKFGIIPNKKTTLLLKKLLKL